MIIKREVYLGLAIFISLSVIYLGLMRSTLDKSLSGSNGLWSLSTDTSRYLPSDAEFSLLNQSEVVISDSPALSDIGNDSDRFESSHQWHPQDMLGEQKTPSSYFRVRPDANAVRAGMVQPIVDRSAKEAQNVFLMIKTGRDVLWHRLPIHFLTTLTKFPNFALYSDFPGSVGGHEVVDILENLPEDIKALDDFRVYNELRKYRSKHFHIDSQFVKDVMDAPKDASWILDRYKNVPMLAHAYEKDPNSDWYVFMDGDSYIVADSLLAMLKQYDPHEIFYAGKACGSPSDRYNFANGGSVVILSHRIMEELFGKGQENTKRIIQQYGKGYTNLGDKAVAVMLAEELDVHLHDIRGFYGGLLKDIPFSRENWCDMPIAFHHVTPHEIEVYWEYEQAHRLKHHRLIREGDLYQDFIRPYLDDTREMWDNELWDPVKVPDAGDIESCASECSNIPECLSWRFVLHESRCEWSPKLRLGHALPDSLASGNIPDKMTSGWMLQRYESARDQKCQLTNQMHF